MFCEEREDAVLKAVIVEFFPFSSSLFSWVPLRPPFAFTLLLPHISANLDLHGHTLQAQPGHLDGGPNGSVVRHPLGGLLAHLLNHLGRERDVEAVDAVHGLPTLLDARGLERQVHVLECLLDLYVPGYAVHGTGGGVPAAWREGKEGEV